MESMRSCTSNSNSAPSFEQCGRFSPPQRPIHIIAQRLGSVNIALLSWNPRREDFLAVGQLLCRQAGLHLLTLQWGVTWASIEVREVSRVNLSQYYSSASLVMSYEFFHGQQNKQHQDPYQCCPLTAAVFLGLTAEEMASYTDQITFMLLKKSNCE